MNLNKLTKLDTIYKQYNALRAVCTDTKKGLSFAFRMMDSMIEKEPDKYFKEDQLNFIKEEALIQLGLFEWYIDQLITKSDLIHQDEKISRIEYEKVASSNYRELLLERFWQYKSDYPKSVFVWFLKKIKHMLIDIVAKKLEAKSADSQNYNKDERMLLQLLLTDQIELSLHWVKSKSWKYKLNKDQTLIYKYLRKIKEKSKRESYNEEFNKEMMWYILTLSDPSQ